ncbi:MAG: DUF4150 domain-containing protein [Polyangiaceae bacterium]
MGMAASSTKGGICLAFPDVCKTPVLGVPVPIPYPNIGQVSNASDTVDKVLIENKDTVVESSKISTSSGDEAGVQMGVVSNKQLDEIGFDGYSSKVYAKGKKIVYHTATTAHNGSNANMPMGAQLSPSQSKVKVAT